MKKKYNKCLQYAVRAALNREKIKKDLKTITKCKPFIDKYNQEEINYPSEKDDCRKFRKNNLKISLSVLYAKKGKTYREIHCCSYLSFKA